jgi:hypothetical protein
MKARMHPRVWLVLLALAAACTAPAPDAAWLGAPEHVAPGVELYRATDPTLVDPPATVAAHLLRLDPERVRLESALARGAVLGAEPVEAIAARRDAVAAVNGGFFNVDNGEPVGALKVAGELVSDSSAVKGAVIIRSPPHQPTELTFDQISVRMSMHFEADGRDWAVSVDGVDTTRARGRLMLYTPRYHTDTDTAANGTEWMLSGQPLRVVEVRHDRGHTPIPRDGVALSYGGLSLPDELAALQPGVAVSFSTTWSAVHGSPAERFDEADHVIGGAGLLRRAGALVTSWENERLQASAFTHVRHPRTLVGRDRRGFIWLVAVDGRQPDHSVGMTFRDLQRLADRLELTDALNLDGGGSTTMIVRGRVVNRPSDLGGPRAVSDAILVTLR